MSRTKRYKIWVESEQPSISPGIARLLVNPVLGIVLLDDMSGPKAADMARDDYIVELALRLRTPLVRELRKAHIHVSEEDLVRICRVAASEAFVVRTLKQALLQGEVSLRDFNHLPFYAEYRKYFEQPLEALAKEFSSLINAASLNCSSGRGEQ